MYDCSKSLGKAASFILLGLDSPDNLLILSIRIQYTGTYYLLEYIDYWIDGWKNGMINGWINIILFFSLDSYVIQ